MFDPIGDFEKIVDGLKPVTLSPVDGEAVPDVTSLRRAVSHKEAAKSNGRYTTSDSVFHVSTVTYATRLPLGSLIIEADGTRWVVLEHAKQTLLARWRYVVRLLEIIEQNEDTDADTDTPAIGIYREVATFTKSLSGALEPTWNRDASPVVARFDPLEETRDTENNYSHFPLRAIGYFQTEFEVNDRVRFVDTETGTIYKPMKATGREKIGELFAVECEVSRWPQA